MWTRDGVNVYAMPWVQLNRPCESWVVPQRISPFLKINRDVQWGSATKNTMGYLKTRTSSDPGKLAFLGSFWEDFPGSSLNLGHGIGKSH